MVREAQLEDRGSGLEPSGEGWFVVDTREAAWRYAERRGALCFYEGDGELWQVGVNVSVMQPGQVMAMYHWEADQEGFLVVAGEALLLVEGEERRLGTWHYFHCPAGTRHTIAGAGDSPCVIVAVGARGKSATAEWGAYVPDPAAARHGASVDDETTDPDSAYASLGERQPARYDGWLPE